MILFLRLALLALIPVIAYTQPDAKQRMKVLKDLAKQGTSGVIPELAGYLKDPDVEIRVEAVKAIVDIGTVHSLDPLLTASFDNDSEIQARATDGLVNFYYPGYIKTGFSATIKRAGTVIKGRFTDTRDQVIDPFIQVRPDVISSIGKLASAGNGMEVRANAARGVGVLRGKAAIPDLAAALRTKDTMVIYEVLIALKKIRDKDSAQYISFLLRDMDKRVQIAALETTGVLQNAEAIPRMSEVLAASKDKDVRRAALTAIAMIADPSSRDLFERFLSDADGAMRAAAAEGLGRLKNPADKPRFEKLFEEERQMNPRLSLALAAVLCGKTELSQFSPLEYLVNTLNSALYRGVAYAFLIEASRDAAIRKSLYPGIAQRTRDEKKSLAMILAHTGDKESEPVLEALSKDPDVEVGQEATRAYRTLKARLPAQ